MGNNLARSPRGKPIKESQNGFQFLQVEFPCSKMPKVYHRQVCVCVCVLGMVNSDNITFNGVLMVGESSQLTASYLR